MDKLIGKFVQSNIDKLNNNQLKELEKFLDIDDDTLYKFYNDQISENDFVKSDILKIFKDYVEKNSGGETGIRTQERVAPLPVFKTGAFNHSAISP